MDQTVSIVMPAFRAAPFIAEGVRSVLAQTWPDWQLLIVADDDEDYAALLAAAGLSDPRLRFLTTGTVGAGASQARNIALEAIDTPYAAILDADDRFKPDKLARVAAALADHAIVSSALDVMDDTYRRLRTVGEGADQVLSPAAHKFVCVSMDSMIAWDRRRCDARYDLELTNMTDLEFLMQLYRTAPASYHLGALAHDYIKLATSMSNSAGFSAGMIASKQSLLSRLDAGRYPMADASGPDGIAAFLAISLAAEQTYEAALAARPGLLFENHLEPLLSGAGS